MIIYDIHGLCSDMIIITTWEYVTKGNKINDSVFIVMNEDTKVHVKFLSMIAERLSARHIIVQRSVYISGMQLAQQ